MVLDNASFQVYKSAAAALAHDAVSNAGAGQLEKFEKTMDEKAVETQAWDTKPHMTNFLNAVRARDHRKLTADVAIGTRSAAFMHLANVSLRVGRKLTVRQSDGQIAGDDAANAMLTRDYREGYVVGSQI